MTKSFMAKTPNHIQIRRSNFVTKDNISGRGWLLSSVHSGSFRAWFSCNEFMWLSRRQVLSGMLFALDHWALGKKSIRQNPLWPKRYREFKSEQQTLEGNTLWSHGNRTVTVENVVKAKSLIKEDRRIAHEDTQDAPPRQCQRSHCAGLPLSTSWPKTAWFWSLIRFTHQTWPSVTGLYVSIQQEAVTEDKVPEPWRCSSLLRGRSSHNVVGRVSWTGDLRGWTRQCINAEGGFIEKLDWSTCRSLFHKIFGYERIDPLLIMWNLPSFVDSSVGCDFVSMWDVQALNRHPCVPCVPHYDERRVCGFA